MITNLKEVKELDGNIYVSMEYCNNETEIRDKEIERLNHIINELEKELKDRIKNVPDTMAEVYEDKSILHRLQELKGEDKE